VIQEIGDPVQRAHYTQQLARLVRVTEQTVIEEFARIRRPARIGSDVGQSAPAISPPVSSRLEEYCLALVLSTPRLLARIAFLDVEAFVGTENRVIFQHLREWVSGRSPQTFDRDEFVASLDGSLQPVGAHLIQLATELSELDRIDQEREVERTAFRLRRQRDKEELTRVEMQLREQDSERIEEEEHLLRERAEFLRRRISDSDKALAARTLLGPRPFSITGTGG
jgi:hypothetical protein